MTADIKPTQDYDSCRLAGSTPVGSVRLSGVLSQDRRHARFVEIQ
jgi:hypothetical protein